MTTKIKPLSEKEVIAYLISHPEIYHEHPHLLEHLPLSHEVEGAVSLVERQLQTLRDKNKKLQNQLSELIENAQQAEDLFHKTTQLFARWFNQNDKQKILNQACSDIVEIF